MRFDAEMLAVKTEERSRQADTKKAGGDVAAVKKVEVTVDHSGPGWMAVSFEKDGQVFAGMMLQANRLVIFLTFTPADSLVVVIVVAYVVVASSPLGSKRRRHPSMEEIEKSKNTATTRSVDCIGPPDFTINVAG